jgi:phage terminase large subunit-like protein
MAKKVLEHPVLTKPTLAHVTAWMEQTGERDPQRAFLELMARRDALIRQENADPLRYGWEPPIWKVPDALLGLPCFDKTFEKQIDAEFGWCWEEFCERLRRKLGFKRKLRVLLIPGTNRSGKTDYAAKRTIQILNYFPSESGWVYHTDADSSKESQQPRLVNYLPGDLRTVVLGGGSFSEPQGPYIKYTLKNGFTDNSFILPNRSRCSMRYYSQDADKIEGHSLKWVWADELIPPDFQSTLEGRILDRDGWMVTTFTPIHGWTPTVNLFILGSEVARAVNAFLLPLDDGGPRLDLAFGFQSPEAYERACKEEPRATVPESPLNWLRDVPSQPAVPADRKFDVMPRVRRCLEDYKGVVYFNPADNPFGNPPAVFDKWKDSNTQEKKQRLYGEATKTFSGQFPKFGKIHILPADKVPKAGTNYQICDPTPGGRPFVSCWIRVTRFAAFVYREFPEVNPSPLGMDVPFGLWAEPSGRKNGINDGDRGPGAEPVGWGLDRYKQHFAALEGWADYKAWANGGGGLIEDWRDDNGADEEVFERFLDCRSADSPTLKRQEVSTLLDDFLDINLDFSVTPGVKVDERVRQLNSLFDFKEDAAGNVMVPPQIYISDACQNTIFCVQNWMNAEGQKGAMKDFVDLVTWFACLNLDYVEEKAWSTSGGGAL